MSKIQWKYPVITELQGHKVNIFLKQIKMFSPRMLVQVIHPRAMFITEKFII